MPSAAFRAAVRASVGFVADRMRGAACGIGHRLLAAALFCAAATTAAASAATDDACLQQIAVQPGRSVDATVNASRVLIEEVGTDIEYRWKPDEEFTSVTTPPDRLGFDVLAARSTTLTMRTREGQGGGQVRIGSCLDDADAAFFGGLAALQRRSLEAGRDAARAAQPALAYLRRWPLDARHAGWISSAYANILASAGENNAAETVFLDSSRDWQQADRPDRAAIALMAAGDNASRANRFDVAREWLTQARDELERLGVTYYALRSEGALCTVLSRQARVDDALACEAQLIPRWLASGELRETAVRQISAGNLSLRVGKLSAARQMFLDAERSASVLPPVLQSRLSAGLGNYELALGNIPAAATHYARAIHRLGNAGLPDEQTNLDMRLAILAGVVGALPDQIRLLESAQKRLSEANDPIRLAEVNLLLAKPLLKLGEPERALSSAATAAKLCATTQNQRCAELAAVFEIRALISLDPPAAEKKLAGLTASESTIAGWRRYLTAKVQQALGNPFESQRTLATLVTPQNDFELETEASLLRAENLRELGRHDDAIAALEVAIDTQSKAISSWTSSALVISARSYLSQLQAALFDLIATAPTRPAQEQRPDAITAAVQATDPRRLLLRRTPTVLAAPLRRALSISIAENRLEGQRQAFAAMTDESRSLPVQPPAIPTTALAPPRQETLLLVPILGNEYFSLLAFADSGAHPCLRWPASRYRDLAARFSTMLDGAEGNLAELNETAAQWYKAVHDCRTGTPAVNWHVVQLPGTPPLPWAWIAAAGPASEEEPTVTISFNLPVIWDSMLTKPEALLLLDLDMPSVAPLPLAPREIEGLASALAERGIGAKRLRAADVGIDEISDALVAARVIHIVGHANPATFGNLYQGLWFESNGIGTLITYPEIASLALGADLVVLSACGTRSKQAGHSPSWNLAEAFIAAGAQRVIAAANPLSDAAAPLWTQTFHDAVWRTGDAARAARRTRQILRESPHFKHPKYWAGIEYFISASPKSKPRID